MICFVRLTLSSFSSTLCYDVVFVDGLYANVFKVYTRSLYIRYIKLV